ncbi:hypothetical protein P691DRAFT_554579 [Macrolepiota fuliginosa MF-IS2]|uniref:Elongator complex protein 5 n=1 Tax=Macrolepiota fuliginosa MF-IS2 TaxID=1400762 RepID=A0A9P5XLL5_9AGAR|nr:hypothetical protein P691DRAFT_554579 [Macrolepiota fuliginosa MF-IS2]
MLLPLLLNEPRQAQPFVFLQSTPAQSILPLLRALCNRIGTHSIICNFLYAPPTLVEQGIPSVVVHDWTAEVPGYSNARDLKTELLSAVKNAPRENPLNIVIDSLETLSENQDSPVETYEFLHDVLQLIKNHPRPSQLIVHSVELGEVGPLLLQTDFSSSLIHLMAHPTSLFRYLSREYMLPPPPMTPDAKFWGIFLPFSKRMNEVERLSFGIDGEGSSNNGEMVVEILTRGINNQSRKRGTERLLAGWDSNKSLSCSILDLEDLKPLFSQNTTVEIAPDPAQNLSFNLSLSESQQQSRAQVPLPYAHEGQRPNATASNAGTIFYDPDSADDIDDDDPDEDLDI